MITKEILTHQTEVVAKPNQKEQKNELPKENEKQTQELEKTNITMIQAKTLEKDFLNLVLLKFNNYNK